MRAPSMSFVLVAGIATAALAALASLAVGVIRVPPVEVARALAGWLSGDAGGVPAATRTLLFEMRLPRAVGALSVGMALGAAGCMLQALLRNPLASPSVIGTAQAAGFGKVLGVLLGFSYLGSVGLSFVTAVLGTLLVIAIARGSRGVAVDTVVLSGVNVSLLFAALIGLVQTLSRDEGQLSRMVLLLLGGLWQTTWTPLAFIAPLTAAALAAALVLPRRLDLLALGEADALRLGLRFRRTAAVVLLLACFLTSLAVSLAGVVAFVGLVVPHAARRFVGPAHAALLPASAFLGGLLVLATDTLARSAVPPNELPLGVVTSILGVPCFIAIMRSMRARQPGP